MAGAAFTTRLTVANPQECSPMFSVKQAEILNVGELASIDSNGQLVVAGKGTAVAHGVFIPNDGGTATAFTGTATGSVNGFLARRAVVGGFTGLTPGGRVYLAAVSSGGANNYTQTAPNTGGAVAGDFVQCVGIAISSTQVQVNVDMAPLGYQALGTSLAALK